MTASNTDLDEIADYVSVVLDDLNQRISDAVSRGFFIDVVVHESSPKNPDAPGISLRFARSAEDMNHILQVIRNS